MPLNALFWLKNCILDLMDFGAGVLLDSGLFAVEVVCPAQGLTQEIIIDEEFLDSFSFLEFW